MGIRDIVNPLPATRTELSDYILHTNPEIKALIEKNPQYKAVLENAVNGSFDKYGKYMGGLVDKLSGLGHLTGYAADAWFLGTGDILGALGGKFINLLAQIPEKAYGIVYAIQTGNYLDAAQNILEGALSYLPGLTFVDQGLTRIIQKRMITDVVTQFEKEAGIYKPWTTKLAEKLDGIYTGVKDRLKNVFRPDYEPMPQPA